MASLLGVILAVIAAAAALPASAYAAVIPGHYIVTLKDGTDPTAVESQQAQRLHIGVDATYTHALQGYAGTIPDDQLAAVRSDPRVASVTPDQTYTAAAGCPICQIPQITTRGVRRIGGDVSSAKSGNGKGAIHENVAVLDSGIESSQPDLNVAGGVDCTSGQGFEDKNGHGTIVAGVIGAKDNTIGTVGVAPGAPLWSVRVLNKNLNGSTSHLLCGIDWVTATRTDNDPSNDIAVANMSIAGPGHDDGACGTVKRDPLHAAICRSTDAGVTYVVAAGNDAADFQSTTPATYSEVLTATAMSDSDGQPGGVGPANPCDSSADDTAASFSDFATLPSDQAHTVAAPGVCISSTYIGKDVATDSGTSYASPDVAGTVALCIAHGPCKRLTPAQIVTRIADDSARYSLANPGYGFQGDPLRPVPGKYYGYLVRAGLY